MARIVGVPYRAHVISWSETTFYINYTDELGQAYNGINVSPLQIMLHDEEMQKWVKSPNGMDALFEPDLNRPGKFKARRLRNRQER